MRINDAIGLLAAIIGTTATLLSAWGNFRSKHPGKGEILRAVLTTTIIIAIIFGFATLISHASPIKINGKDTIPIPTIQVPAPQVPAPTAPPGAPGPGQTTPTSAPTSSPTSAASPSSTQVPSPSASSVPTQAPLPSPVPTQAPGQEGGGK